LSNDTYESITHIVELCAEERASKTRREKERGDHNAAAEREEKRDKNDEEKIDRSNNLEKKVLTTNVELAFK
jgi:hypothetical protein